MVRLAFVALALLAAAGPVQAALSIAEVRAPTQPIAPTTEIGAIEVDVVVDCSSVFARSPPPSSPEGVQVSFAAPDDVVITGAALQQIPSGACQTPTGTATLTAPFQVSTLREAAGLRPLPVVATAVLLGAPLVPDVAEDTADFQVTPGPFLAYQAEGGPKLRACGCPLTFDVAVTNLGNVRTTFTFALETAPAFGTVTLPQPFEVDPSSPGSTSIGTGKVVFDAPSGSWGEGAIVVSVTGAATADPGSAGTPVTVGMLVRNADSQGKDVPALDPALLVLSLAGLACLAARRRA